MVSVIVIPIIVVAIVGLLGYLVYRYLITDMSSRRTVQNTLRQYNIDKTPSQIVREYYKMGGDSLSERDVQRVTKEHMRTDPDSFLEMYDKLRESMPRSASKDSEVQKKQTRTKTNQDANSQQDTTNNDPNNSKHDRNSES